MYTIVSVFPKDIIEHKPQVPNEYVIPRGTYDNPGMLKVSGGYRVYYVDHQRGSIEIPIPEEQIAKGLIFDLTHSMLAYRGDTCQPGIFAWPGEVTTEVKKSKEYQEALSKAKLAQETWFLKLVELADNEYAKTGSPGRVSDLQRMAAKSLGMNREWLANVQIKSKDCPFCGQAIRDFVAKCPHCGEIVDKKRYQALQDGAVLEELGA